MIRSLLYFIIFTLAAQPFCQAQSNPRYLVLYKDKANSPFSIDKPTAFLSQRSVTRRNRQNISIKTQDLPVNPDYVAAVKQTGARIIYSSRWFNGSVVEASAAQLTAIKKLAFYKGIELNLPIANLTSKTPGIERVAAVKEKFEATEDLNYGGMNAQLALMEVPELHKKGFHGENMLIAVLDNGFNNGNIVPFLKHLKDENRVIDTHDFVSRDSDVYADGSHGLAVLSTIAANQPSVMIGAAFKASFALYRTENDLAESPYEEVTWLLAAERADSLGADIINSSLGYTTFEGEFDTDEYNHTYADMDGKTTIVSRAARFATRTGMIVTNSAGNDGNKSWHFIGAPADVDSVFTVGASNYDRSYAALSSVGPNAAGIQKPDVAAVGAGTIVGNTSGNVSGGSGTSFSSPLIAGVSALFWQAHPELTAQQVIYVLKKSGHQASAPDNLLGYGVPNLTKAEEIFVTEFKPLGTENELLTSIVLAPNPVQSEVRLTIPQTLVGQNAELVLLGVNGKTFNASQSRLTSSHTIPTGDIPSGLYLINIKVASQERTLKFIKR